MATGLLQQNFKTYSETVPIVFTFFFFFFLLVAMTIIMEDRISSVKKKRITQRSFSKGKHPTYVPVSELFSTHLEF